METIAPSAFAATPLQQVHVAALLHVDREAEAQVGSRAHRLRAINPRSRVGLVGVLDSRLRRRDGLEAHCLGVRTAVDGARIKTIARVWRTRSAQRLFMSESGSRAARRSSTRVEVEADAVDEASPRRRGSREGGAAAARS